MRGGGGGGLPWPMMEAVVPALGTREPRCCGWSAPEVVDGCPPNARVRLVRRVGAFGGASSVIIAAAPDKSV